MKRIDTLLVANRGEIASRIMRTARRMGITTVAVFSDADEGAPFVRDADVAVRIGPPPSSESYLVVEKLIEAAKLTGADAVHPGFGFLAENADFAAACAEAGLIFVGPSPDVIRQLGSKREAKRLMQEAGVPVVPGYNGDDQSVDTLLKEAEAVGFPLLIKASAGGGGKGMRIARGTDGLRDAIEGAKREAKNAFGDDSLLLERYVEKPRHVEVQILGDGHGRLVHLYERECSIQRRHQKIIEETPSPGIDDDLRERICEAAVNAGKAVGYVNAGTVEFIVSQEGEFFFLEVNTRLQVEHPITECITGIDIVREQIRIARGEALDFQQGEVPREGAAVECRLYAEDPENGFLPTSGTIVDWHLPDMPGLRVDSGVETGTEVGIHYDPMLAKIITSAPTRPEAILLMRRALATLSVQGIRTNRAFLSAVLAHERFAAGDTHTHFIDEHMQGALEGAPLDDAVLERALFAATLAAHEERRAARSVLPALETGYRNNRFAGEWVEYAHGDDVLRVEYRNDGRGRFVFMRGESETAVQLVSYDGTNICIELPSGLRTALRVVKDGMRHFVHGLDGSIALVEQPRFPDASAAAEAGACIAPMPGKVVKVLVSAGEAVEAGAVLVILEAMKMEHSVKAAEAGTVVRVDVAEGDQVDDGQVLAVVEGAGD